MTTFILRFILFSGLLYLLYRLAFSRMSFFKLNRGLLLLIPVASLLIPLLAPFFEAPQMAPLTVMLQEIDLTGNLGSPKEAATTSFNWYLLLYALGAVTMLLSVGIGLLKGWRLVQKSTPVFENVCLSEEASGPFAFFSKIVIPSKMADEQSLPTVLAHEKAHVDQRHGFDNLCYNLLSAIFWFNPFMHLLSHELKQVHECLADEAALQKTSRESYASLLLSHVFGNEISFDAANPFFNSSLIKTRITMIYKQKTKNLFKWLYLALMPLLVGMILFSCGKVNNLDAANKKFQTKESQQPISMAEVDRIPLFKGCDASAVRDEQLSCFTKGVTNYMIKNLKFPEAFKNGNVLAIDSLRVSFVIESNGSISNVKTLGEVIMPQGISDQKFDEIVKARDDLGVILYDLPITKGAMQNGKEVPIQLTLPIKFTME